MNTKPDHFSLLLHRRIRIISLLLLLFATSLRLLFSRGISVECYVFDITVAASLLLMIPEIKEEERGIVPAVLTVALLDLVLVLVSSRIGNRHFVLSRFLYFVIGVIPMAIRVGVHVRGMVGDTDFLSSFRSGWETAASYLRLVIICIYGCIFILFMSVVPLHSKGGFLFLLPLAYVFYLWVLIRSITGVPSREDMAKERKDSDEAPYLNLPSADDLPDSIDYDCKSLYIKMRAFMADKKPYLNPAFGVDDLARSLYTNRGYLSRMVNTCTNMNFNTMVNRYRICYAMEQFKANPKMKVADMYPLCGFNNNVTMNNSFKLVTGMTPGEWCDGYRRSLRPGSILPMKPGPEQ